MEEPLITYRMTDGGFEVVIAVPVFVGGRRRFRVKRTAIAQEQLPQEIADVFAAVDGLEAVKPRRDSRGDEGLVLLFRDGTAEWMPLS